MKLWLCVTQDEYELPMAVADGATELAKMLGTTVDSITSAAWKARKGKKTKYRTVDVNENEDLDEGDM